MIWETAQSVVCGDGKPDHPGFLSLTQQATCHAHWSRHTRLCAKYLGIDCRGPDSPRRLLPSNIYTRLVIITKAVLRGIPPLPSRLHFFQPGAGTAAVFRAESAQP